jgi:hypothetical protein
MPNEFIGHADKFGHLHESTTWSRQLALLQGGSPSRQKVHAVQAAP